LVFLPLPQRQGWLRVEFMVDGPSWRTVRELQRESGLWMTDGAASGLGLSGSEPFW
jgi:hypothetical protein